jgi:hypothetical protein
MARRTSHWSDWVPPDPAPPPPNLVPIYGCKPFVPGTTCDDVHPAGPIPRGSACCCAVCHRSGVDGRRLKGEPVDSRLNEGWSATPTAAAPPKARDGRPLKGGRGR